MIVKDYRGNELLEIISVEEEKADTKYEPINHCLAVVKVGSDYLLGWNKYRTDKEEVEKLAFYSDIKGNEFSCQKRPPVIDIITIPYRRS